jgi:hypothetical protein
MKRYLILCTGLLLMLFSGTCSHDVDKEFWIKTFGGAITKNYINACETTGDGGCLCAGTTYSDEAKEYSVLIIKINSDGTVAWHKNYSGDGGGIATSIIKSSAGGHYIVAGALFDANDPFRQKNLVLCINEHGSILSQKTYTLGKYGSVPECLYRTRDGGLIVGGYTNDPDQTQLQAIFMLKIDRNGVPVWQKQYSHLEIASVRSVFQTSDDGFLVAGNCGWRSKAGTGVVLKLDANGDIQWQKLTRLGAAAAPLGADGYIVAASTSDFYGPSSTLVFSLDLNGNVTWAYTLEGLETGFQKILQTTDSGYVIAGQVNHDTIGNVDIWFAKLSKSGMFEWQKNISGTKRLVPRTIFQTPGGSYIVAGNSESEEEESSDALMVKLDRDGTIPGCTLVSQSTIISQETSISIEDANMSVQNLSASVTESLLQLVDVDVKETTLCSAEKNELDLK